jgi:serine phosphatase RsbU (regulator of sigma subunit)
MLNKHYLNVKMATNVFIGTIKEKFYLLINMLGHIHYPLLEYIQRRDMSDNYPYPQIESIEVKIVHLSGHHEVVKFDQTELQNIEIVNKMKRKLMNMERSKRELFRNLRALIRKTKNMKDEIKMMENMK